MDSSLYRSTSLPVRDSIVHTLVERLYDVMAEPEYNFERDYDEAEKICAELMQLDPDRGARMFAWVYRTRWMDDRYMAEAGMCAVVVKLQGMGLVSPYEPDPFEPFYTNLEIYLNENDLP